LSHWKAYFLRCLLCAPAIAGILAVVYREKAPGLGDNPTISYISASVLFTVCACCGWASRVHSTRIRELLSAGLVAGMIASGLIAISDWQPSEGFLYLYYFYDNGYLLTFQLTAPLAIALLTMAGCFIPDDPDRA